VVLLFEYLGKGGGVLEFLCCFWILVLVRRRWLKGDRSVRSCWKRF